MSTDKNTQTTEERYREALKAIWRIAQHAPLKEPEWSNAGLGQIQRTVTEALGPGWTKEDD